MPKRNDTTLMPYQLGAWRARMSLAQEQCSEMLGVSASTLWRFEKSGMVPKGMVWACYGIERYLTDQKNGLIPPGGST